MLHYVHQLVANLVSLLFDPKQVATGVLVYSFCIKNSSTLELSNGTPF